MVMHMWIVDISKDIYIKTKKGGHPSKIEILKNV